jgi:hypothetical protein
MKMHEMLETINDFTSIKIIQTNEEKAEIILEEYNNLHYTLLLDDIAIVEAVYIAYLTGIKVGIDGLFTAAELLQFRRAIKEDLEHLGSIYDKYFFKDEKRQFLKDEVNRQYLLDYITFINRTAGIKTIRLKNES